MVGPSHPRPCQNSCCPVANTFSSSQTLTISPTSILIQQFRVVSRRQSGRRSSSVAALGSMLVLGHSHFIVYTFLVYFKSTIKKDGLKCYILLILYCIFSSSPPLLILRLFVKCYFSISTPFTLCHFMSRPNHNQQPN